MTRPRFAVLLPTMMVALTVSASFLLLSLAGCSTSQSQPATPQEFNDPGVPIRVAKGETFNIVLSSDASTDSQWQILQPVDESILLTVGQQYSKPLDGQPGTRVDYFTFQAAGTGDTVVHFRLLPSGGNTPTQTSDFSVQVR